MFKKQLFILIPLYFFISSIYAQSNKIVFFDSLFNKTENITEASFMQRIQYDAKKELYLNNINNFKKGYKYSSFYSSDSIGLVKEGKYKQWHKNGNLAFDGEILNRRKYGPCKTYYENGKLMDLTAYPLVELGKGKLVEFYDPNGKQLITNGNGPFIKYWEDNTEMVKVKGQYKDGYKIGQWIGYDSLGNITFEEVWKNKKLVKGIRYTENNQQKEYTRLYEKPKPVMGMSALNNLIMKNIVYPPNAINKQLMGYVRLSFKIDDEGNTKNVKIQNSSNTIFENEALRVFNHIQPKWEKGLFRGKIQEDKLVRYVVYFQYAFERKYYDFELNTPYLLTKNMYPTYTREVAYYQGTVSKIGEKYNHSISYLSTGQLHKEYSTKDLKGYKKDGLYQEFYPNGRVKKEGHFVDRKKDGLWTYYDNSGNKVLDIPENKTFSKKRKFENYSSNNDLDVKEILNLGIADSIQSKLNDFPYVYHFTSYHSPLTKKLKRSRYSEYRHIINKSGELSQYTKEGQYLLKDGNGILNFYDEKSGLVIFGDFNKIWNEDHLIVVDTSQHDIPDYEEDIFFRGKFYKNKEYIKFTSSSEATQRIIDQNYKQDPVLIFNISSIDKEDGMSLFMDHFFNPLIRFALYEEVYVRKNERQPNGEKFDYCISVNQDQEYSLTLLNDQGSEILPLLSKHLNQSNYQQLFKNLIDSLLGDLPEFEASVNNFKTLSSSIDIPIAYDQVR
ncbi:TonB family protein [Flammeovirga agarivorans]|uniref:TonB family protein n=1 Tax=Flammeovirga agarivorans TaxID=2726742 RepID=A0A7X8SNZ9_9BACT|nr:TonB family protein [Flammeovirga agarivorans]NLR93734.1 TonB family protein [Flammeovirga agarivorans]